ncbi:hypothetical protein M1L60_31100 [Actinoplanes sp. TRM 88003]|uniref:Uncharacterized protein n=1 Tax=Paractinoplanes aksuensis TaxID=2939490 RepID=A0ABT1DYS0_9ACTN|nr:hypothetical protein [Actinoplanes aksuensis]MCO8275035.1 hypothetical protein [Actinoplanes aksuensis]
MRHAQAVGLGVGDIPLGGRAEGGWSEGDWSEGDCAEGDCAEAAGSTARTASCSSSAARSAGVMVVAFSAAPAIGATWKWLDSAVARSGSNGTVRCRTASVIQTSTWALAFPAGSSSTRPGQSSWMPRGGPSTRSSPPGSTTCT